MKKIIVNKEDYTAICKTAGAIAIMHSILSSISEHNLSKKDIEDVISDLLIDFIHNYNSQLEKAGWEDTRVNNLQAVSENTIIKEDD